MSVAVATKPVAAKPVKVAAKPAKVPTPTGEELAKLTAAIRERWNVAEAGEVKALDLFKAAGIAWENSRVIKVRVAWAAATVKLNAGEPNLLNACRILFADPEASAKVRTSQAEAKKMTLRNYVDAGKALDAEGLAYSTGEPTAEERKIVAAVFREGNKRDKAEAKEAKEGEQGGSKEGEQGGKPEDAEAVTYAHLVAHVAGLNNVLKMIKAGSVPISEREAGNMADMLNEFQMQLSAYADGK